jgi:hypothetical protein
MNTFSLEQLEYMLDNVIHDGEFMGDVYRNYVIIALKNMIAEHYLVMYLGYDPDTNVIAEPNSQLVKMFGG